MHATAPASTTAPLLRLRLAPAARATADARTALRALPEPVGPHSRHDLELLVTEAVSNSVRHAGMAPGERIDLRVLGRGPELRVEVRDPGDGFDPDPSDPGPASPGGRGMMLIDRIARRWGVERDEGTCVWFEIDWAEAA